STVSPADFIPLAERSGFIVPLGEWIIKTACAHIRTLIDKGWKNPRIAINISQRQLKDHQRFIQNLLDAVKHFKIKPEYLELEITESMVMDNIDNTFNLLDILRNKGFVIAIDDFGTGHSSLSVLKTLPVNTLKIDRSFIQHMRPKSDDAAIVEAIFSLAKRLNMQVIAEGVENAFQAEFLGKMGCHEIQGFYFFRPQSFKDLLTIFQEKGMFNAQFEHAPPPDK
ncbi:EAL domain-containing protein, partial [Magnetococcales bacterium HHB-1]